MQTFAFRSKASRLHVPVDVEGEVVGRDPREVALPSVAALVEVGATRPGSARSLGPSARGS